MRDVDVRTHQLDRGYFADDSAIVVRGVIKVRRGRRGFFFGWGGGCGDVVAGKGKGKMKMHASV